MERASQRQHGRQVHPQRQGRAFRGARLHGHIQSRGSDALDGNRAVQFRIHRAASVAGRKCADPDTSAASGCSARWTVCASTTRVSEAAAPIRRRATPDIACQRGLQRRAIRRLDRRRIDLGPAMERFPHRAHALADAQVAHADLAQVLVHVAEHGIEHRLGQGGPRVRRILQPVDQQEGMQRDHVEPPVQRVRHPQRLVEPGLARRGDRGGVQGDAGPLVPVGPSQTPEAEQSRHRCHRPSQRRAPAIDNTRAGMTPR